jgi:hypothetical protein
LRRFLAQCRSRYHFSIWHMIKRSARRTGETGCSVRKRPGIGRETCGERSDVRPWRCCHHPRLLAVTHYRRREIEIDVPSGRGVGFWRGLAVPGPVQSTDQTNPAKGRIGAVAEQRHQARERSLDLDSRAGCRLAPGVGFEVGSRRKTIRAVITRTIIDGSTVETRETPGVFYGKLATGLTGRPLIGLMPNPSSCYFALPRHQSGPQHTRDVWSRDSVKTSTKSRLEDK